MITKSEIEKFVSEKLQESNIFVVEISITNTNLIKIYLDKPEGITISDCRDVNKSLVEIFGERADEYEIEVSSPGLSRPFKVWEQYLKYSGKEIEIITKDDEKIEGIMIALIETKSIEMDYIAREKEGKKVKKVNKKTVFKIEEIKSAKPIIKIQKSK